jgi:glycosyltransferase involved in cell wall biosynthesis
MTTAIKTVHIRLSDTGWILERLARELADRLPYISYDTFPDGAAKIQYYMTYGCREKRVSPIEVAWFTHKEQIAEAAAKFDRIAREVDFAVSHSLATEELVRQAGASLTETISPGVDLDRFQPRLRIGVVGRTYHTGRKGEALVAAVMDLPGIDWHFTGPGWPGPAHPIAEDAMPEFYRSLDYVLVPALIEGGPMCVVEALASGCPVIASPVGWVPQFPHIPFRLGDAGDLRRVLSELLSAKMQLRQSVEAYTWDAFAAKHHVLFCRLLGYDPLAQMAEAASTAHSAELGSLPESMRAYVVVHGNEMSTSLGGPSVRAPRTAAALRKRGLHAEFVASRAFCPSDVDVAHVLNVWHPTECETVLKQIARHGTASVLSPIFLDLSERHWFAQRIPSVLAADRTPDQIEEDLGALRPELLAQLTAVEGKREPLPGYFAHVRRLVPFADHVILLSEHERQELIRIGVELPSASVVRNPVDAALFSGADPALFEAEFGVKDYVLCVGRIESRKNQALLALALRDTGLPLVFIGHEPDAAYAALVRKWAGPQVKFVGRIDPSGPMLASALAGARVFCLPSWSEGAPLAALEAAAAGCNMVLSNRSAEREYFGDLARYADPADPRDLREQVLAAHAEGRTAARMDALQALMARNHSWAAYAEATAAAYRSAMARRLERNATAAQQMPRGRLFLDLTTMAHHKGTPTGIARVEERIAAAFCEMPEEDVQFIYWDSSLQCYLPIDHERVRQHEVLRGRERGMLGRAPPRMNLTPYAGLDIEAGDRLIVLGSAWMRNPRYVRDVTALKQYFGVHLTLAVHDVIQWKHTAWYPKATAEEFVANARRIFPLADLMLLVSECTRRDTVEFMVACGIPVPPTQVVRLGDDIPASHRLEQVQSEITRISGMPFVLFVSTLDYRKNHRLLLELWRRLLAEYGDRAPTLVMVGGTGWRGEETLELLASEKALARKVLLLQGINDASVEWLYRNCLFTVYPSLYEGWGLPVAESVRRGAFCIASDSGSIPEVAPGFVEHIHPLDFVGWYNAIVRYSFNSEALRLRRDKLSEYVGTSWEATAEQVAQAAWAATTKRRWLVPLRRNVHVSFRSEPSAQDLAAEAYLFGGWSRREKSGTWTVGTVAALGFGADLVAGMCLAIRILGHAYAGDWEPLDVIVLVNEVMVARWQVDGVPRARYARVPHPMSIHDPAVRVSLQMSNPRSPAATDGSEDVRMLGYRVDTISYSQLILLQASAWSVELVDAADGEFVFDLPQHSEGLPFLGLRFSVVSTAEARLEINGVVAANRIMRPGVNVLAVNLGERLGGSLEPFSLKIVADRQSGVRLMQAGVFPSQPVEALIQVMRLSRTRGRRGIHQAPVTHAAFAGATPQVRYDEMIAVSKDSPLVLGLAGGWHAAELDGVWSNGQIATLWIRPPADGLEVLRVTVRVSPLPSLVRAGASFWVALGSAMPVDLGFDAQDQPSGFVERVLRVRRTDALDEQGRLAISLLASGSMVPADIDDGPDARALALKLASVCVATEEGTSPQPVVLSPGSKLELASSDALHGALAGGWCQRESQGVWSDGGSSDIHILASSESAIAALQVSLEPMPSLVTAGPLVVHGLWDGVALGSVEISDAGIHQLQFTLPEWCHPEDGLGHVLTLKTGRSASAREHGTGDDRRLLSFKLHGMAAI